MKYLKLNLILSFFIVCFSVKNQAMIEPRIMMRDTIQPKLIDDGDEVCAKEVRASAKAALGGAGIFLIPTALLSSTFLISKSVFKSALVLSLVKGAALASSLFVLGALITFFALKRRLKKKNWDRRSTPIIDKILSLGVASIGLISVLSVFFFSIPTLVGLGFLLKLLNIIVGGFMVVMGVSLLPNDK